MLLGRCEVVAQPLKISAIILMREGAATITTVMWGDVIEVITSVFGITQTRLAEMMFCNKAKITRIKNGKETPALGIEEIFADIFDPNNPESAARSSETAKYHLSVLKDVIESDFKEIFEAMADCWEEEDYKAFVLTLLGRAKQGASSKKQKKMSLDETPPAQMCKIFEQAVADYKIATYICKLPDYLSGESFDAEDIFAFIDTIQTEVLGKFVNQQNEDIFKKISDFKVALESYASFLGMIRWAVSEKYGIMWKIGASYYEVLSLIDDDRSIAEAKLENEEPSEDDFHNRSSIDETETYLNQLSFLHSILLAYKQICDLYSEICTGKTLLVF